MRPAWGWTETDIEALIKEQRPEDLALDYKKSEALDTRTKTEISKDVSAMANSAGGLLIYGIDENRPSGPIRLDGGVDPLKYSPEWLEQVIDSNIKRRIDGVRVRPISMGVSGANSVYVVSVPQSNLAPHMAGDHRYYKRLGTTTAMMEEYEVRDVGRRSESPELEMTFVAHIRSEDPTKVILIPFVENLSPEPAFYATFRLYVADDPRLKTSSGSGWTDKAQIRLAFKGHDEQFQCFHLFWGTPERRPLLEGEKQKVGDLEMRVPQDSLSDWRTYHFGYELRSPKMSTRMYGAVLQVRSGHATILEPRHDLRPLS